MNLKDKIILIWLTYFFTFLGVSKIFTIIPFLLEVKIQNRSVENFIELIFKPTEAIIGILSYAAVLTGPLFFLMAFVLVLVKFLLYTVEGFLLAKIVLVLARSEKTKNLIDDLSMHAAIKLGAKDKINAYGEQKKIKYLAVGLIFIFLVIFSYSTIKEKFAKKPVVQKLSFAEQADKIDSAIDSDNDVLSDKIEFILGTDRYLADTDADGYNDYAELINGHNPFIMSPDDKLSEETVNLVKSAMANKENIEFEKLENVRKKLGEGISNNLCRNSPYSNIVSVSKEIGNKALQEKDPCICTRFAEDKEKNNCYIKMLAVSKNYALCNYVLESAITGEKDKASCFHASMLLSLDEKYCLRIKEGKDQGNCFMVLGLKTNNYAVCDKAINQDERDDCYWGLAIMTKNESLCDKIDPENKSGNSRESCRSMAKSSLLPKIGF